MTVKQSVEIANFLAEWAESYTDEDGKDYVKCLVCEHVFGPNVYIEYVAAHLKECNT